jgi:hypothetical protein
MPKKKKHTLGATLTALEQAEAHVQLLRKQVASERTERLKALHSSLGFASRGDLIAALTTLGGARGARSSKGAVDGATAAGGRRKRARITPDLKNAVLKAIKDGGSGISVAKQFGISSQSVQNIKKAAGLVRARKKRTK